MRCNIQEIKKRVNRFQTDTLNFYVKLARTTIFKNTTVITHLI